MKKIISLAFFALSVVVYSQVKVPNIPENTIENQNPFFDASGYTKDPDKSLGKGLYFPQTDLTQWIFMTDMISRSNFVTAFDGMVVYNTTTGTVNADGSESSTKGQTVEVTPGFYYFYNPTGADTRTVTNGKWVRIDGGNATPAVPNSLVATGTFNHDGGNSAKLTNVPKDIKAITGVKIVRTDDNGALLQGGVAATTFYSYEKATKTIVFGQGVMSTSMPAGTYSYVIEYTK